MGSPRGVGSSAGAMGAGRAVGSHRASSAGAGGGVGGPDAAGTMPGTAALGFGAMPDSNVPAGSRQMGTGGFGAMRGGARPEGGQFRMSDPRIELRTERIGDRFGRGGLGLPSPEVLRQREKERRRAWMAMRGRR